MTPEEKALKFIDNLQEISPLPIQYVAVMKAIDIALEEQRKIQKSLIKNLRKIIK